MVRGLLGATSEWTDAGHPSIQIQSVAAALSNLRISGPACAGRVGQFCKSEKRSEPDTRKTRFSHNDEES